MTETLEDRRRRMQKRLQFPQCRQTVQTMLGFRPKICRKADLLIYSRSQCGLATLLVLSYLAAQSNTIYPLLYLLILVFKLPDPQASQTERPFDKRAFDVGLTAPESHLGNVRSPSNTLPNTR